MHLSPNLPLSSFTQNDVLERCLHDTLQRVVVVELHVPEAAAGHGDAVADVAVHGEVLVEVISGSLRWHALRPDVRCVISKL